MTLKAEFRVRTFREGDEEEIIQLFESCYREYGGYVVRTPEYWRWCCLERPDVGKDRIFVAFRPPDGKIVGYVVVGKSGNIWEFAYDQQENQQKIVQLLMETAVECLMNEGSSSINVQAPTEDDNVRIACRNLGFAENKPAKIYVSVLDFQNLLLLLASMKKDRLKDIDENLKVNLNDAPKWLNNNFGIKIRKGLAEVLEQDEKPTISVEGNVIALGSLLFANTSPFFSWFHRKVKVKPFWKIRSFLKLFSILQAKMDWSTPLSDYG